MSKQDHEAKANELQTLANNLQLENNRLQEQIDHLTAEKMSCDQGWGAAMRDVHELRTQLIKTNTQVLKLQAKEKELTKNWLEEEAKRKDVEKLARKVERKLERVKDDNSAEDAELVDEEVAA